LQSDAFANMLSELDAFHSSKQTRPLHIYTVFPRIKIGKIQSTARKAGVGATVEEIGENLARSNYGFDHIGLQVEDLQAAHDNLVQRGYSFFVPPTETADTIIAFFKGPENISIELVQPL